MQCCRSRRCERLPKASSESCWSATKSRPGNPVVKADGTVVRTLWGELAWQLGGKKAFARIAADDEKATSPGDVLRELFNEYGPCLILIDEWVAYARQLHDEGDLPARRLRDAFHFRPGADRVGEAGEELPAGHQLARFRHDGSPHAQADDEEVGGSARTRGAGPACAMSIGRVEVVVAAGERRRRLRDRAAAAVSSRLVEQDAIRDAGHRGARAFADLYRTQQQEFPPECRDADYEKRLKAAYPIHPEVFDRLYTDWSTLVKFQRTRGVLRLMAAVIHSLWEKGDRNPLILPANIPIDDPARAVRADALSVGQLGAGDREGRGRPERAAAADRRRGAEPRQIRACRRVARTIYLGSAPTATAANRGIEDRRVKLGCVMPGETPRCSAMRCGGLSAAATYLYQDGPRYWYSTQPTVTKLAEDRAEQLKRNPDTVVKEIDERLRTDLRSTGDFRRIHADAAVWCRCARRSGCATGRARHGASLQQGAANKAQAAAKAILRIRGNAPRLFRNALVFLAVDQDPPAGSRRSRAPVPRLGVDPR